MTLIERSNLLAVSGTRGGGGNSGPVVIPVGSSVEAIMTAAVHMASANPKWGRWGSDHACGGHDRFRNVEDGLV